MSIDDVMSRVATLQQLAGAAASPTSAASTAPTSTAGSTSGSGSSFADALASAADASLPLSALGSDDDSDSSDDSSSALSSLGSLSPLGSLSSLGSLGSSSLGSLGGLGSSSNSASALLEQLALAQANGTSLGGAASGGISSLSSAYPGTSSGAKVLAAATTQLGVTEDPPGSNDGPALDAYRSAVAGSQPGQPWCAEFASWAAAQAGEPIGDLGQGLNSVAGITDWASRTGRLLPASATPAPGDLILYGDRHVGIVESVNPDGSLTTVEGNYGNAVQQVHRSPSEATGYVQM